jgi:FtsH-binding integral membrane protein
MNKFREVSIWFFIGVSLLVNGALIFSAGVYEFISPPVTPVVLSKLHANLWWGAVLLFLGVLYCVKFRPRRESELAEEGAAASSKE